VFLFLRSRRTAVAIATLAGVAAVTWWTLDQSRDASLTAMLLTVMPLGAAAVIGGGTGSPFGETERTASFPVPALRFEHLGGLLLLAALALTLANQAESAPAAAGILVRNGAGYAGLALLTARLTGAGLAWLLPVGYGMAVWSAKLAEVPAHRWWMWPAEDATDGSAWVSALLLLALGLAAIAVWGARDEPGEVA